MENKQAVALFWFRRDLRLEDNAGLYHALKDHESVLPIFIFDKNILEQLDNREDRRVAFIHETISRMQQDLLEIGSSLLVIHNTPIEALKEIAGQYKITAVYANHDYEPYALKRDQEIAGYLQTQHIDFKTFKDQVIFEMNEVLKPDKTPYTIFTPYSRMWKQLLTPFYYQPYPVQKRVGHFLKTKPYSIPSVEQLGFKDVASKAADRIIHTSIIRHYEETRNLPAVDGTSRLSVHLRFGTVSIRKLVKVALEHNETWLNELIWREFFMCILYHFPQVVTQSFKQKYEFIQWRNNEAEFEKWCTGNTGYPIVDAGMRELNETGFMHNRVRMVTASFLTKHLLIDWRWGEAYFAEKLLDYDLSANNGNWQWAAGCGCDAAPYFRIFNPEEQAKKFDSKQEYIKKWVPEFGTDQYPEPMVDHKMARVRVLATYKEALDQYKE